MRWRRGGGAEEAGETGGETETGGGDGDGGW